MRLWTVPFFALLLLPSAVLAQDASPSYTSIPSRNMEVVVSNPEWRQWSPGDVQLVFNYRLQHPDGSDVSFQTPMTTVQPVRISGWSLDDFDATITHAGNSLPANDPTHFRAGVPGLNPHSAAAHLEFDVRDPTAPPSLSGTETSTMTFNAVPVPTTPETPEPVNYSYTTPWGAVITMTDITPRPQAAGGQGALRYHFTVDHSKVPDDVVVVRLTNAYDGGVPIDGAAQLRGRGSGPNGTISTAGGLIDGTVHKSVTLEFEIDETSTSQGLSTAWIPLEVAVPLANIPPPPASTRQATTTTFTLDGTLFTAQNLRPFDSINSNLTLFYAAPTDPKTVWRITDAAWPDASGPSSLPAIVNPGDGIIHFQQTDQDTTEEVSQLTNDVNWHLDGTPLAPNESAARFWATGSVQQAGPLAITAVPTIRRQLIYSFSGIKVPASGQQTVIDLQPDHVTNSPLVLHSVRYVLPEMGQQPRDPTNVPYTLSLAFVYSGTTG